MVKLNYWLDEVHSIGIKNNLFSLAYLLSDQQTWAVLPFRRTNVKILKSIWQESVPELYSLHRNLPALFYSNGAFVLFKDELYLHGDPPSSFGDKKYHPILKLKEGCIKGGNSNHEILKSIERSHGIEKSVLSAIDPFDQVFIKQILNLKVVFAKTDNTISILCAHKSYES